MIDFFSRISECEGATAHQSRHGPEECRRLLWRRFRLRLTGTNSYNPVTLGFGLPSYDTE